MKFTPMIPTSIDTASPSVTAAKRIYTDKHKQLAYIEQWRASNLSRDEFCQQHNLNRKTFANWCRSVKQSSRSRRTHSVESSRTKLLDIAQHEITVSLPNGVYLKLSNALPTDEVLSVLKEMSQWKFD